LKTVGDVGRLGTFMLNIINGPKRKNQCMLLKLFSSLSMP